MYTQPTTVLHQLLQLLPEQQFETFVGQHNADRYTKKFTTFNQLTTLLYAQMTGKECLREIESDLRLLDSTWTELGLTSIARSTLSRANTHRPAAIFESLFYVLLEQCKILGDTSNFTFKNQLHAIDASSISVCLSLFDWAKFRKQKGAIRLHVGLDIRHQLPDVLDITDGKTHEVKVLQKLDFSKYTKGTIFVMDRGYNDFALLWRMKKAGHHFVIRRKSNTHTFVLKMHRLAKGKGVWKDERIAFALSDAQESFPEHPITQMQSARLSIHPFLLQVDASSERRYAYCFFVELRSGDQPFSSSKAMQSHCSHDPSQRLFLWCTWRNQASVAPSPRVFCHQ